MEGPLEAWALEDAFGERTLEGALEARAPVEAFWERALERTVG